MTPTASTLHTLQRSVIAARRRASIRMAELFRLAAFRRQFGVVLAPDLWLFALAATLASAPAGRVPVGRRGQSFQWHGLDSGALFYWIGECELGRFSAEEIITVITAVERWRERNGFTLIKSDTLAEMLSVTAEERWACRISTIGAIDETREERAARTSLERKERDRERNRAKRAGKHKPRATALSQKKPWDSAGISRATWYRRRHEIETTLSPDLLRSYGRATNLSHDRERDENTSKAA